MEHAKPPARTITVGVILFPGFEPLDVVGPVSVFGSVPGVNITYIAQQAGPVRSVTATMALVADASFADLPAPAPRPTAGGPEPSSHGEAGARNLDWLLVPGGIGTRTEVKNQVLLDYLRSWSDPAAGVSLIMSVCTGAALLAAAGVLDGRQATSNKMAWEWVTSIGPKVQWVRKARWVHDDRFLTSSGVTAGTDAAVYAVKTLVSAEEAAGAAKRLEHQPITQADQDPFADAAYMPAV